MESPEVSSAYLQSVLQGLILKGALADNSPEIDKLVNEGDVNNLLGIDEPQNPSLFGVAYESTLQTLSTFSPAD